MFCPSCGAPNPDEAKFCNECGARVAPPTVQGGNASQQGTLTGAVDPARRTGSGQGTLSGMSTHDIAASMVTGPSRRQMTAAGVAIGLLGIAVGAVGAWRSTRQPPTPPVTPLGPVGLLGDPSAVTAPQTVENDAGTVVAVVPQAAGQRAPRVAARTPTPAVAPRPGLRPTTPAAPARPTTPAAQGGGVPDEDPPESSGGTTTTIVSGNIIHRDSNGNMVVTGPDGEPLVRLDRTGGADAAAPSGPPPAENGVIERGPRTSQGGFREGDETDATGTMDPAAFQFVYRHYQSQIASCWSSASRGTEIAGVMVVRVRIAEADGHVSRTRIVSDSTRSATLQACVQNAIRAWRYPAPEGGDVEVDYPLRFGGAR